MTEIPRHQSANVSSSPGHIEREFGGRTVLITGAAGGIGMATARQFAKCGARLFLIDRSAFAVGSVEDLRHEGAESAVVHLCDVTDEDAVVASYARATELLGGPSVVVNVAGEMIYKPLVELTRKDWEVSLSVNLLAAASYIKLALREMAPGGAIINVSSVHAVRTTGSVAPYAVAKAGLISLTHSTAIEGKPRGIRANAILPGAVDTELLRQSPLYVSGAEKLELSEIGTPGQVAPAIVFLASARAAFITGATLVVDGGRLATL